MHDGVPVTDLLRTVFESILEVFVLCLAGLLLARASIIDKATQRKLNRLNISLFTPCLLFSKVAFSLNPQKIKEMWIVPLGFVVVTGTSMGVAWGLGTVCRLKKSQKAFAMAAAGFMNSNSLPIALMQSLVVEVPGLKWDNDDTKEAMLGRALTYLVLYSTLGMVLRWSFGVRLLTMADDEVAPSDSRVERQDSGLLGGEGASLGGGHGASSAEGTLFDEPEEGEEERESVRSTGTRSSGKYVQSASTDEEDPWKDVVAPSSRATHRPSDQAAPPPPQQTRRPSDFHSFPNSPKSVKVTLARASEDEDEEEEQEWELRLRAAKEDDRGRFGRIADKVKRWATVFNEFMTVPMWSALISIMIALIPPVQAQLATLRPIRSAIKSSGACSIPVTLLVLGAYFWGPDRPASPPKTVTQPPRSSSWWPFGKKQGPILLEGDEGDEVPAPKKSTPGEKRTIFVAIMSRMIITPLLLIPVIALLAVYDPFEVAEDPIFITTAVLVISSPPAITLAQITQASSGDAFESLITKTIWISYGVLTPPLTLGYVVLGLWLSRY